MVKYLPIIILALLIACNTGTGNNSKYIIAESSPLAERGRNEGRVIFQNHCASCHNPMKDATGPALNKQLIENRTDDWVYMLLTNPKKLRKDSAYTARLRNTALPVFNPG